MFNLYKVVIVFLITFLCVSCGYDSYDECLLEEMRGQVASMLSTTQKVCEREFPYEKKIYSWENGGFKIGWYYRASPGLRAYVDENNTDYRITRVDSLFSSKSCEDSNSKDFTHKITFEFNAEEEGKPTRRFVGKDYRCMNTDRVLGILK